MIGWLVLGVLVGGPMLVALVLALRCVLTPGDRAALREADEVDAAWRDSLRDPVALGLRPDGSVFYVTSSSIPIPVDAPTGPITGVLPQYRGEPL